MNSQPTTLWLLAFLIFSYPTSAQTTTVPTSGPHPPTAAILSEPDMPIKGTASSPNTISAILKKAGLHTRLISATEMADSTTFNAAAFDILVLPTGESFPVEARDNVVKFLRDNGNLITMGGYAFNHLVRFENGQWRSEEDVCRVRMDEATRKTSSMLANGDMEARQELARAGATLPGQWTRTSPNCTIVREASQEGQWCAKTIVRPEDADKGPTFWQEVACKPGTMYQVSGWLRSDKVIETGMAYIALYQYDSEGKLVTFRDFAVARGTTDWTFHKFVTTTGPGVVRLVVKFGLYQTHGTAWFDDIRLSDITGGKVRPMNTSTGKPMDGLVVAPEQIGMFDASFPLKRAVAIGAVRPPLLFQGVAHLAPFSQRMGLPVEHALFPMNAGVLSPLTGWAASGVVGADNARWIPLIEALDRYGRSRGAAGAMLIHYNGYYAGSCWAYFGVDNADLFADVDGPMTDGLASLARFMVRKTFLRNLKTNHRFYTPGERGTASVFIDNRGPAECRARVTFVVNSAQVSGPESEDSELLRQEYDLTIPPGKAELVSAGFGVPEGARDLCGVTAFLSSVAKQDDGEALDEMSTGFVVDSAEAVRSGPQLRFRDNYFTLDGRPMFLFGTDAYSNTYQSSYSNPLTWAADLQACVDVGLNLYENLNYVRPNYEMTDDDWRNFRGIGQLSQNAGLVFMPGMLIGHNVAIGDDLLVKQSALCGQYARRLKDLPGLLYYINGDYQMMLDQHSKEVEALWNRWLKDRYGTTEKLRTAWSPAGEAMELGMIPFWLPDSGKWNDTAIVDRLRFQNWLTRRWNESHVAAIRAQDALHPITSEYYQICWGGMDLIQTIDGQDVSNFGFFSTPGKDLDILPLKIRFNDLRVRGKGVCLGEYGVKTHPAWSVENGASDYHIVRTEEQQIQLFMAVAHYALGMGAAKVQNWCLQDAQDSVFPWGLFYPNRLIPKDVARVHRNQSLIWRHFSPRYLPSKLTVCIPNNLRLGNFEAIGRDVADRCFETLLGLHYDFNVIDDNHLDAVSDNTKAIIYPCPFSLDDSTYGRLLSLAEKGTPVLVTGDISYDGNRKRTRTERLKELAGVEFVAQSYPDISRPKTRSPDAGTVHGDPLKALAPCIRVKPAGAELLAATAEGEPTLTRNRNVYLCLDPTELSADDGAADARRKVYSMFLTAAGLKPLPVDPDVPWLHVTTQPTAHGMVHVLFNRRTEPGEQAVTIHTAAGRVTLNTRNRWPALAAVTSDGKVVAINAYGRASVGEDPLMRGSGMKALLSLDGQDLRQSKTVLIAPFQTGTLEISPSHSETDRPTMYVLDFADGQWREYERLTIDDHHSRIEIDEDRATCVLVLDRGSDGQWREHLKQAMLKPASINGY